MMYIYMSETILYVDYVFICINFGFHLRTGKLSEKGIQKCAGVKRTSIPVNLQKYTDATGV